MHARPLALSLLLFIYLPIYIISEDYFKGGRDPPDDICTGKSVETDARVRVRGPRRDDGDRDKDERTRDAREDEIDIRLSGGFRKSYETRGDAPVFPPRWIVLLVVDSVPFDFIYLWPAK